MLDRARAGAELVADAREHRGQRLGLALGDAARRLVEQDHRRPVRDQAGQVDDAPRAGRQLVHELRAERLEAQQLDQLVDPRVAPACSASKTAGRWRAACSGSRTSTQRSSATAMHCSTVSAGNRRASWNDRPRPRRARPSAARRVTSRPPSSTRAGVGGQEAGDQVEQRRLAGAVGPDDADDLARARPRSDTSSTAADAAEAPGHADDLERRRAVRAAAVAVAVAGTAGRPATARA